MSASHSVFIFDDHPIITDGVRTLLSKHNSLVISGTANTKAELDESLKESQPDVLILDVVAPDVTGLELFKTVSLEYPRVKLVAYTTLSSTILIENLLINGAYAYINKRQEPDEICRAILQVCNGEKYVPDAFLHLLKRDTREENPVKLSQRELEILNLILDGKLSKEIATILSISQNTVENHRTNLFKKFRVSNLAELFRQSARLGYLTD